MAITNTIPSNAGALTLGGRVQALGDPVEVGGGELERLSADVSGAPSDAGASDEGLASATGALGSAADGGCDDDAESKD
ncbi:MAG: hypothetical protein KC492_37005, partial [Myxococcales bacterium]|nr:hypothetical protein [Myxococcales bacterium]